MILQGHFKAMLNFDMHFSIPRLCRYNKNNVLAILVMVKKYKPTQSIMLLVIFLYKLMCIDTFTFYRVTIQCFKNQYIKINDQNLIYGLFDIKNEYEL